MQLPFAICFFKILFPFFVKKMILPFGKKETDVEVQVLISRRSVL